MVMVRASPRCPSAAIVGRWRQRSQSRQRVSRPRCCAPELGGEHAGFVRIWRGSPPGSARRPDRQLPWPAEGPEGASSSRPRPPASLQIAQPSRAVTSPSLLCEPASVAYLRPFRMPVRSRPPAAAPSRAADPGESTRDAAVFRSGFGCFGFFGSRFDRLCPFAIADSVTVEASERCRRFAAG